MSLETLTTPEAALAAGVSVRDINRMVDEHILPEDSYSASGARTFRADACLWIAFYRATADRLTADTRLRMMRNKTVHSPDWEGWRHWSIQDDLLTVRFDSLWESVNARLRDLAEARELVVEDEEILGGTPILHGTRVPVHDVGAALNAGVSIDRVLQMYPSLNERQVKLASMYAKAAPLRGRPRRLSPPQGAKVRTATRRLRKSSVRE